MNSGFMPMPKSLPACFPDVCSSKGKTTFSIVPGRTVLRMMTTWNLSVFRSSSPIRRTILRTCPKSKLPFSLLGVPTQTKEISPSFSTSWTACSRPASTPSEINASKPGSITGLLPELMRETFISCKSTPVTEWPISAKHAAVTQPT